MNRRTLSIIFREIKKAAKLDFALTHGECCQSCTWASISNRFGKNAKGIWLKWFEHGANRTDWREHGIYYIGHDLNAEQKDTVYNILKKYCAVEWDFSDSASIKITL